MTTEFEYDVFISYSHVDEAWVQRQLVPRLKRSGLKVCTDQTAFRPGAASVQEMERGILTSRRTVLVLTPSYLESRWARFESVLLQTLVGLNQEGRMLPILLIECNLPLRLSAYEYLDFTDPTAHPQQFKRLVAAIKGEELPPPPRPRAPNQAPPLPLHYVPREEHLARLRERSKAGGAVPLTAIHGMGGVGKSVLAAALAHDAEAQKRFPDGVLWATLGPEAQDAAPYVLDWGRALGWDLRQWETDEARVRELRRALQGRRCLLVVDDVWPAGIGLAKALWSVRGPYCCALLTTRYAELGAMLEPPAAAEPVDVLSETQALALFAARWGRAIGEEEKALAQEVAERVGRLPLAVLLAAARAPDVAGLKRLLQALRAGQGALQKLDFSVQATRDQGLKISFDESYKYLSERDARRYRLLGAVPAQTAFGAEEAAVLWEEPEDEARDALERLAAHALLDAAAEGRWRQHLLLRQDARQRAEEVKQDLGPAVLRVVWAREDAWDLAGRWQEQLAWLQEGIACAREASDGNSERECVLRLGHARRELGEVRAGLELYERVQEAARAAGDKQGEGNALGSLGLAYAALGDARKAIEHYQAALVIAREIGDRRGEGGCLGNLGLAYAALGDARKAIEHYQAALVIAREIGDRRAEGADLGNLGLAYAALGDAQRARAHMQQALTIFEQIESPHAEKARQALEKLGNR